MLKKLLSPFLLLLFVVQVSAQDINKIINKAYVDDMIKTLSSDAMEGRATFTPGIDRAATFIEGEFKKIGLQPLTSLKGFRQTFYKYQVKPVSATVSIDGKNIAPENVLVMGNTATTLSFDQTNSAGWVKLDPEKPFPAQFRALIESNKQQLVLVDHKFANFFKQLKNRSKNGSYVDEKDLKKADAGGLVFILTRDTVAKDFKVAVKNTVNKMPLFNVAGVIPGKSKAKEIVVFSGHYDHIGILPAVNGDSIANGADDNATGTSAVIALAKYYKKLNNNERTLIFVAFTAEEMGGYGAKYFSEQLNPEEVIAMFNIEMIGKESKFGKNAAFITGFERSDFGKILQKNLQGSPFTFHPDPYPEQNLFYRSDNATLAALGVPAHTISTDQIDTDKLYHTVDDEYDTLAAENVLMTIKAIAKSAISIIKGEDTPMRIQKLEL
ncbi:M20/M25/M40 family metallo-hydrolase [Pedobacter immunditicola]|uniref:M20/M25/M40 family metallo-hydrolase n=1 Tax=Pedobacter immunditicola TaxID=3133440 RepID=UPI003098B870